MTIITCTIYFLQAVSHQHWLKCAQFSASLNITRDNKPHNGKREEEKNDEAIWYLEQLKAFVHLCAVACVGSCSHLLLKFVQLTNEWINEWMKKAYVRRTHTHVNYKSIMPRTHFARYFSHFGFPKQWYGAPLFTCNRIQCIVQSRYRVVCNAVTSSIPKHLYQLKTKWIL